jgi:hypothetical protein
VCQDGNHDSGRACPAENVGGLAARAAGGQHVIDQENGLALEGGGGRTLKSAFDVDQPTRARLAGLLRRVPDAPQQSRMPELYFELAMVYGKWFEWVRTNDTRIDTRKMARLICYGLANGLGATVLLLWVLDPGRPLSLPLGLLALGVFLWVVGSRLK